MVYKSNCKINIGLDIVSKREDGYHNLSSLFYPVYGLYDTISITLIDSVDQIGNVVFTQSGMKVDCADENNLCVKAYWKFKEKYTHIKGVHIDLNKKIPFGAGLGGGSSNAATVIKALNEIFNIGATQNELCDIAKSVGSDVPFFIINKPVIVSGTGDVFSETALSLEGYHIIIIKPEVGVSTKEAYSMITPKESTVDMTKLTEDNFSQWNGWLKNDFEKPIFDKFELLIDIKNRLLEIGCGFVMMSGSGSSIYGISKEFIKPPQIKGCFTFVGKL